MDSIKPALVGFAVAILTALSIWLQQRNAQKKRALKKAQAEEPGESAERPSKAVTLARHAVARADLVAEQMKTLSSTQTPIPVDLIQKEVREEVARRLVERDRELAGQIAGQLTRVCEDRIDRWAHSQRSDLPRIVRSEIQLALTDSGSGVQPVGRGSLPSGSGANISDESSNDRNININVMSPVPQQQQQNPKRRR